MGRGVALDRMDVSMKTPSKSSLQRLRSSLKFRSWRSRSFHIRDNGRTAIQSEGRVKHALQAEVVVKHYSPSEIAKAWGVSVQTIRQIFESEEGVLKIGRRGTRTRRRYFTLRIPESVAERVHTRLSA
jgi:hypothetical protein